MFSVSRVDLILLGKHRHLHRDKPPTLLIGSKCRFFLLFVEHKERMSSTFRRHEFECDLLAPDGNTPTNFAAQFSDLVLFELTLQRTTIINCVLPLSTLTTTKDENKTSAEFLVKGLIVFSHHDQKCL